jgi:hypothetical protein
MPAGMPPTRHLRVTAQDADMLQARGYCRNTTYSSNLARRSRFEDATICQLPDIVATPAPYRTVTLARTAVAFTHAHLRHATQSADRHRRGLPCISAITQLVVGVIRPST